MRALPFLVNFMCILLCTAGLPHFLNGQAWTRDKQSSYTQLGFSSISGDSKYSNQADPIGLARRVQDLTFQLYHEYGLSEELTLIGSIPIKLVSSADELLTQSVGSNSLPAGDLFGFGNVSVAAVYGLRQNAKWVSSLRLRAELGTSASEEETGLRTGVGAWSVSPSIHLGYGGNSVWLSADAGVNFRTNDYSTQWYSAINAGTKFSKVVQAILQFDVLQSLEDGSIDDTNFGETGLYTNDLEYAAFALKLGFDFSDDITLWATLGGGISGHDVTRAPAFSLAVSYEK